MFFDHGSSSVAIEGDLNLRLRLNPRYRAETVAPCRNIPASCRNFLHALRRNQEKTRPARADFFSDSAARIDSDDSFFAG